MWSAGSSAWNSPQQQTALAKDKTILKEVKLLHLEMTKVKNTKNMQTLNNERINWLGSSFI